MASGPSDSSTSTPAYLHISGISIDFSKFSEIIESAEVWLCGVPKRIVSGHDASAGTVKKLREKFDRPMKLSRGDAFSVRLLCKTRFSKDKHEDIDFDTADMFRAWVNGALRSHEYRKSHDGIAIVVRLVGNAVTSTSGEPLSQASSEQAVNVNLSEETLEIHPTTDEIFRICPRFRILVIGKARMEFSGVGKSSLINHAFGVQNALASNEQRGEANIDTEHISKQNEKFVLHDSKGFEPGEEDNVKIVQEFIQRRRHMKALGDRLHAVWICFEIPRAGGRLLETGTEDFLKLKSDGVLGKIPVVVVLTKYDKFMDRVERTLNDIDLDGLSDDTVKDVVRKRADTELRDICAQPLEKIAKADIPYAMVSTKETHKGVIARLIQITKERVCQHVASEASVMTAIAQRVDPKLKINASIDVGKTTHWKALSSTAAFTNRTAWACLEVLHTDIVRVWNFPDPHHYLDSKVFKVMMVNVVDKMDVGSITKPNTTIAKIGGVDYSTNRVSLIPLSFASNGQPGNANIDTEYISEQTDRFVLHDSKGFEPGEEENGKFMLKFIQRRKRMEALGDGLHAGWLCLEILHPGGRLLDTGTEDFLQLKRVGKLGENALIRWFFSSDEPLTYTTREYDSELMGLSDDAVEDLVKQRAGAELDVFCRRLVRSAGSDIPYAAVTSITRLKKGYKEMAAHLIQTTTDRVRQHVVSEASMVLTFAQRVDAKANMKASIMASER
ncbi:hypothetical protein AZE42_09939 [Rhizopogon vesiculosus]|uniref:G domain-containing protein n=1 Tax=Rhizopogon vesiculosus TaxID=180088 RepID=A0A1J8PPL0_9AGAM|nr:hypothetical protein AZE42_09939 [Rhizopogon vesiculosus]